MIGLTKKTALKVIIRAYEAEKRPGMSSYHRLPVQQKSEYIKQDPTKSRKRGSAYAYPEHIAKIQSEPPPRQQSVCYSCTAGPQEGAKTKVCKGPCSYVNQTPVKPVFNPRPGLTNGL